MNLAYYPWQRDFAQIWLSQQDQMAHAWLFHGLEGIGKRQLILALAARLLCEAPSGIDACGQCQSCLWIKLGHHPDLMRVRPAAVEIQEAFDNPQESIEVDKPRSSTTTKPSSHLLVDQIRALEPWYHRSTHRSGWRIVLLYPAQALMVESANALLKSLEEPPPNTLFLLSTPTPDRLLPTILSRCQRRLLPTPDIQVSQTWLKAQGVQNPESWLAMAGGAPVQAQLLSQTMDSPCPGWLQTLITDLARQGQTNLAAIQTALQDVEATAWLDSLQRLAIDLCLSCAQQPVRYLVTLQAPIQALAARQPLTQWMHWQQWITEQRRFAQHPFNARLFIRACLQKLVDTVHS